ncbi:MAG: alpha-glucosidase [Sphaerochaeta sp.]|nr:alpha-glucosidase [Sphaerochaeta sp.]
MLQLKSWETGWTVVLNGFDLMSDTADEPALVVGVGRETIHMHHGNFEISDTIANRETPVSSHARMVDGTVELEWEFPKGTVHCRIAVQGKTAEAEFSRTYAGWNRFWLNLVAQEDEAVWGCGEQFSHFNLRGKSFPLWTREQGVGRNKSTPVTRLADADDMAGGDYHTTFYPQPTFVSSRLYWCHAYTFAYAEYDFSQASRHVLHYWELPKRVVWGFGDSLGALVSGISATLGRQPELPEWVHDGIVLGIQDGTGTCMKKLERAHVHRMAVAGIWAQDWQGQNHTNFGKRLLWNWQWNRTLYPDLDRQIEQWKAHGIRFLGYVNPYLLSGYPLYDEAVAKGYVALTGEGTSYEVDFGEFWCAIVDFTNPEAFNWYVQIIRKNLIDFGLSGWMADFGEYLPTDVVLHSGIDARLAHNEWPGLWAKVNRDAVDDSGRTDILYFMRAGNADSLRYCPMMWAGDQNVDWSEDDGLPSAITAALSLAMSGMGLHHSDIGGYTTLYGMHRSRELLMRWAEFAVFTPMMRTHEGNRPGDNHQFDSDDETLDHIARCTRLFVALREYRKDAVRQNTELGLPVMRPLVLHYPISRFASTKDCYLFGRDLLVAPVIVEGERTRTVDLPNELWVHLSTGKQYTGGITTVEAPLGQCPAFYRPGSPFSALFASLRNVT